MTYSNKLDRLSADIQRSAARANSPFVVAIDGRSGAGKSTLAELLARRLDALVISGDDFFAGGVTVRQDPASVLAEECIDWRRLKDVMLSLLSKGQSQFHPFDWEAFDGSMQSDPLTLEAHPIVIVEGVYSARPELRELIDFSILIEVSEDLRMRRLLDREGEIGPWEQQWHRAEDWYFENRVGPEDFDVVVSADGGGVMERLR